MPVTRNERLQTWLSPKTNAKCGVPTQFEIFFLGQNQRTLKKNVLWNKIKI